MNTHLSNKHYFCENENRNFEFLMNKKLGQFEAMAIVKRLLAIDKAIVKRLFFWFFFEESRSFGSQFDLIVGWFTQVNTHDSSISVVEYKLHHDEAVFDSYCYGWGVYISSQFFLPDSENHFTNPVHISF